MRKWECGIIRQRELRVEVGMWNAEKKDWEVWKVELGMRPPAHRGLRLRPGGNTEKKDGGRGRLGDREGWKVY
jgi:hypothetical protein